MPTTRKLLRFPLKPVDQQNIDATAIITTSDGPPDLPETLSLEFKLQNSLKVPALMPLFPGTMRFFADTVPDLVNPKPEDPFSWDDAQYETWSTIGTLMISLDLGNKDKDKQIIEQLRTLLGAESLLPDIAFYAWYYPVRLTKDFLFNSIRGKRLLPQDIATKNGIIKSTNALWDKHAVSGCFNGKYAARLNAHPTDPEQDDVALFDMPSMIVDPTSASVKLQMTLSSRISLDDNGTTYVKSAAGGTAEYNLKHPQYPLLQTREYLRGARAELIGGDAGNLLADKALAPWPAAPRYYPVQFTPLAQQALPCFSGLLTSQTIKIADLSGNTLQERRLPSHGLILVGQNPTEEDAAPPQIDLSFTGDSLKMTETNGLENDSANIRFNFSNHAEERAFVVLQPKRKSNSIKDMNSYAQELAELCSSISKSGPAKKRLEDTFEKYQAAIRPAGETKNTYKIFRGTETPWVASIKDLSRMFFVMQQTPFTQPRPYQLLPGNAMILSAFEGLWKAQAILSGTEPFTYKKIVAKFNQTTAANTPWPWPIWEVVNADKNDIRSVIRSVLLWYLFGLDSFCKTLFQPSETDPTKIDNYLEVDPNSVHNTALMHNQKLQEGRQLLNAAGIPAPSFDEVDNIIVMKDGPEGQWPFTLHASFYPICMRLQYSEFLRRTNHASMPAGAGGYPGFCYIAYNAHGMFQTVTALWEKAALKMTADPNLQNPIEGLMWTMDANDIIRTPKNVIGSRSTSPRILGLHFDALANSYGAVFPRVL